MVRTKWSWEMFAVRASFCKCLSIQASHRFHRRGKEKTNYVEHLRALVTERLCVDVQLGRSALHL